jgi:hypothetical protein
MPADVIVTLAGLTRPELADLKHDLGDSVLTGDSSSLGPGRLGALDPTTASVILSAAAMTPLALFLIKNRRGPRIYRAVKVTRPDGAIEEKILDIDFGESTSDPKAINAAHPYVSKVVTFLQSLLKKPDVG